MTTLKQLQALVDAGDKANQDIWNVVGLPWNTYTPYINTKSEDPHFGRAIIDVIEPDCIEGEDDEDIARLEQELEAEMYANMEFVSLAANSRPAIKSAIAEIEAKDKEIERLREALEFYADPYNWGEQPEEYVSRIWIEPNTKTPEGYNGFEIAKQALGACETTERSEDNDE